LSVKVKKDESTAVKSRQRLFDKTTARLFEGWCLNTPVLLFQLGLNCTICFLANVCIAIANTVLFNIFFKILFTWRY